MNHILNGFIFEINKAPGYLVSELNIRDNNLKYLVFNCNGYIGEINISDIEKQFVEKLCSCEINKLEKHYTGNIDMTPSIIFNWKLDCSFDKERVISSGNTIPKELDEFIAYLRTIGMHIPLKKK